MINYQLEVCVDSLESVQEAVSGGATRLELCGNLVIGGTTPGAFMYRDVKVLLAFPIPIHVLIRPRSGDFCYNEAEVRLMVKEIKQFRTEGADGVAIGALNPDGSLNMPVMERLCLAAGDMKISLNRAFDMCLDPFTALNQAKELGISTILTSGQHSSCLEGASLIKELMDKSSGKTEIMACGGVNAKVIKEMREKIGISSFHMSGKVVTASQMIHRNPNVQMGFGALNEYEIWKTDKGLITQARHMLEAID